MTWSILARDEDGRFGIAIASRFFAVGALCIHSQRAVGAVATQALMNPLYGTQALALLAAGNKPLDVIAQLTKADEGRAQRQLHVLAAQGRPYAHTGDECIDWCGHHLGDDFSVAGNMLAGPAVVEETARAFRDSAGQPLGRRLLAAMAAGEAAGGDNRGKQGAALRIHGDEDYPQLDLRVDDHPEPITELHRLYEKSLERFQPFVSCLAGRHSPAGLIDRTQIEARIQAFHAQSGH